MSRSHLSQRWRPQVLAAIDAEMAILLRKLRATRGRLKHDASESSQGSPPAAGDVPRCSDYTPARHLTVAEPPSRLGVPTKPDLDGGSDG